MGQTKQSTKLCEALEHIKTDIEIGIKNKDALQAVLLKAVMAISVIEGKTDFYQSTAKMLSESYPLEYAPKAVSDNNRAQAQTIALLSE